jgi:DNA replication protein DnaC
MILPARYEKVKYEDVPSNIQCLIKDIQNSRKGIYIHGECGTGKTHIAYAITKHLQENIKFNVKLYNIPSLIRHLKEDFNENNKQLSEENTNFGKLLNFAGLLVLDDFGTEKLTEWVEESVYSIINERYERMLPIIFTSNLEPSKLVEKYGDRIVSRIIGSCDVVELKGDDKRIA